MDNIDHSSLALLELEVAGPCQIVEAIGEIVVLGAGEDEDWHHVISILIIY